MPEDTGSDDHGHDGHTIDVGPVHVPTAAVIHHIDGCTELFDFDRQHNDWGAEFGAAIIKLIERGWSADDIRWERVGDVAHAHVDPGYKRCVS